jgi:hypothetical protein
MTAYEKHRAEQMFLAIEELRKQNGEPSDPSKWWHFIKDYKFWIEVAKVVFTFIFKIPIK